MIRKLHEEKKDDPVARCFLDGYFSHHKCACKYFAAQVQIRRYAEAGRN